MPNLNHYIKGVHHIGITVEDMGKTLEFYTEVLGGKLITPKITLEGDTIHNAILQKEEIEAVEADLESELLGIPNLREGIYKLDMYFVQFTNIILQLLQYRPEEAEAGTPKYFPAKSPYSSPAVINSMHISFHLDDNLDINHFVKHLEEESQKRGMDQVKCNRIVRVHSEAERQQTDIKYNACKLLNPDYGDLDGWTLVYCKGPNGEQLQFNQVLRHAKVLFNNAAQDYQLSRHGQTIKIKL